MSVKAGPFLQTPLRPITPNDDTQENWILSPHFAGRISVKMMGLPYISSTASDYFKGRQRLFCFQIQGRFEKEWDGDDIEFGVYLEKPISHLPFGHQLAVAFIKVICAVFVTRFCTQVGCLSLGNKRQIK